jgi:hypothetical protein
MSAELANHLARRVVALFEPGGTYFTNGTLADEEPGSWDPATTATFDTGVIAVGPNHVGIVWFTDEGPPATRYRALSAVPTTGPSTWKLGPLGADGPGQPPVVEVGGEGARIRAH